MRTPSPHSADGSAVFGAAVAVSAALVWWGGLIASFQLHLGALAALVWAVVVVLAASSVRAVGFLRSRGGDVIDLRGLGGEAI